MKEKVIIGLSGGVDSSVAALLLKQQGVDVEAVFMRNWDSATNQDILGNPDLSLAQCPQEQDFLDAAHVANTLKINLHRVDFIKEYWDHVFSHFLKEVEAGRTPNPDILCNKEIKFKAFLEHAEALGATKIAMGHYAQITWVDKEPWLIKAVDHNKDQTYFLCQLSKKQLEKAIFPIGGLNKKEVRQLALQYGLVTASKKDSTGICFIGERHFGQFLQNYLPANPGLMKTLDGEIIKEHHGLMHYTIGQRKGLGIGGLEDRDASPWFVLGKDIATNTLYVGQGFHHPYLYTNRAIITDINWLGEALEKPFSCHAKFRYRQPDQPITIHPLTDGRFEVRYPHGVRAVTPGQTCAFYFGERCLGGGTIESVFHHDEKRMC